jgi:MSHA biogenesis protein MshN
MGGAEMSLINKMLQDLDARGGNGARADASSAMRAVSYGARGRPSPLAIGAALLALAVLGGGGFWAYKYFRGGQPAAPALAATPAAKPGGQPAAVPAPGPVAPVSSDEGAPVVPGAIPPEQHEAAGNALARKMQERNAAARRAAAADKPVAERKEKAPRASAPAPQRVAAPKPRVQPAPKLAAAEGADGGLSSQQKAENEYRRALAHLQEARVSEAIAGLEQAVFLYPRHEAARQTVIGLLIEAGRPAEAIRHLTFATSLDPRQANMAMLLARLQLEQGGNALETLQRSLPYAESNADYRALLAGVLQRSNRHKEAAEHYQAALRLKPGNAVWWMGMGISLQADKRAAEAKVAFQRARDSGTLAPELQTFVERRLQELK